MLVSHGKFLEVMEFDQVIEKSWQTIGLAFCSSIMLKGYNLSPVTGHSVNAINFGSIA